MTKLKHFKKTAHEKSARHIFCGMYINLFMFRIFAVGFSRNSYYDSDIFSFEISPCFCNNFTIFTSVNKKYEVFYLIRFYFTNKLHPLILSSQPPYNFSTATVNVMSDHHMVVSACCGID